MIHRLLPLLVLASGPALAQNAPPVQFFGQDAPATAAYALAPSGHAVAAQSQFLDALDPASISFFDFESVRADYTDTTPPRSSAASLEQDVVARFQGYGTNDEVPARVYGRNGNVVRLSAHSNQIGTWATSGSRYLYSVAYDGSHADITDDTPNGTTQTAIRLDYDPALVTAGRDPKPFSAFGAYITDTEGYSTIRLTLTPLGGGTPVELDYGPITNQGSTGSTPGNAQVSFVGFTDFDSQYERIEIGFTDRPGTVDNEAYGFDDFVIGEVNQVQDGPATLASVGDAAISDVPGWRLLSAPVRGVTVNDLAQLNLVTGVPAGDGVDQAQYPDYPSASPPIPGYNLYWGYGGGTRWDYDPVPTTGSVLRPGRGFWWYWYHADFDPGAANYGSGTGVSRDLIGFELSATGPELRDSFSETFDDNTHCASDQASCPTGFTTPNADPTLVGAPDGTVTPDDDDFYMIGNPYPSPYLVSAITATGGTLQDAMFVWNPARQDGTTPRTGEDTSLDGPGSYEILFQTPLLGEQAAAAVWQGMLAEVTKTAAEVGDPVTFKYDIAGTTGAGAPPFHGLTAGGERSGSASKGAPSTGLPSSERYLHLVLEGTTASERAVWDDITYVRFRDDAADSWDRYDASKPVSPAGGAGLALLGDRDGELRTQAVLSLSSVGRPEQRRWAVVHLAFVTDEAGTYTISWEGAHGKAMLRDRSTGEVVRMHRAESYTFEAGAGDWSDRFAIVFLPPSDTEGATKTDADLEAPATRVGTPLPNPTVGSFRLDVQLATGSGASVSVYDALGRRVREVRVGAAAAARGTLVTVPAEGLAPGVYSVTVEAPGVSETRRVTVVR